MAIRKLPFKAELAVHLLLALSWSGFLAIVLNAQRKNRIRTREETP
jgi:hypothetical protein